MDFEKKKSGYMCATLWHFFHFLFYLSLCLLTTYKSLLCFSIISYCTLGLFLVRIRFTSANSQIKPPFKLGLIESVLEMVIYHHGIGLLNQSYIYLSSTINTNNFPKFEPASVFL